MNNREHPAILSERNAATLILTLNTPGKRNVLGPAMYDHLLALLDEAEADNAIANVILQGAGGFFCAGGDLRSLGERTAWPVERNEDRIEELHRVIRRVHAFPKPIIAAIEGGAAGAGASLALACDLIVAAEESYMALSYVKAGLVPDGGATARLARSMPPQLVAEMALFGQPISASRLATLGIVNRLATAGAALEVALDLAATLAKGARAAQSSILALLDGQDEKSLFDQLDRERAAMARAIVAPDAAEGIAAFHERRTASFPGPSAPPATK